MTSPYSAARWHAPVATTGLWALAAGAAVFWALRFASPAEPVAAPATLPRAAPSADADAVARLLGVVSAQQAAAPAAPEAASRFALLGVVADPLNSGAALIAIDGKPPRPFRVGARVGEGYVLQSVDVRAATLGAHVDGPAAFTLQLPVRATIDTGIRVPAAPVVEASPQPPSPPQQPAAQSAPLPPAVAGAFPATMPPVVAPPPGGVQSAQEPATAQPAQ